MTGISEVLVLILLIACILILPRMLKGVPAKKGMGSPIKIKHLNPSKRLSIFASILYPVIVGLILTPWENGSYIAYLTYGVLPVLIVWGLVWILAGKKKAK